MSRVPMLAFAALFTPLGGGCESAPKAGMSAALADYAEADYAAAQQKAARAARSSNGAGRESASYLAGVSAYRAGDADSAERHLLAATGAADPDTAGRAQAQLGLLRMDQQRFREAGDLFRKASQSLTGEDARLAAHHAALAYQKAGDPAAARTWAEVSRQPSGGGEVVTVAMSVGPRGGGASLFTLQVGAYHDHAGAEWAVRNAAAIVEPAALGPVRIIETRDVRGKPLYLVQFGRFASRNEAASARLRLGRLDYIIAALAGPS
jgi:hypothetical protein